MLEQTGCMNSIVYLSKCSYVKIFITLLLLSFVGKKKMTRLLFISLSYDTKIVKIFIYFNYRNDFPWSKDFLFWENFEYQIDVPFKSIINIAVVNTKFALRWNYIMKVISNRFRSVVSLTASCCVRQCWCIQPHCKTYDKHSH